MKERINLAVYLLTKDEEYLPTDIAEIDIKKYKKKNDLQRTRLAKRILSDVINEMKESKTSSVTQMELINN